jgi:serine/threonine-protein kinase
MEASPPPQEASPIPNPSNLQLGDGGLFARIYRPEVLVGSGGAGVVYRALDTTTGGVVALKVLRTQAHGDALSSERRVALEAKALSRLASPYVPRLHALFQDHRSACIVMDFVEGPTLREVISHAPIKERRAVRLALQLASALAAAHESGFIHRDVKSTNVRLAEAGSASETAMLLDFGATKVVAGEVSLTDPQILVGTVRSASPEQLRGDAIDHRTDIYSLGLVMYEMLTGRRAHGVKNLSGQIHAHLYGTPIPMCEARPEACVSPATEAIVRRCLAKSPEGRFQTMAELCTALEARLAHLAQVDDGDADISRRPLSSAELETVVLPIRRENPANRATVPDSPGLRLAPSVRVHWTPRASSASGRVSSQQVFALFSSMVFLMIVLVFAARMFL